MTAPSIGSIVHVLTVDLSNTRFPAIITRLLDVDAEPGRRVELTLFQSGEEPLPAVCRVYADEAAAWAALDGVPGVRAAAVLIPAPAKAPEPAEGDPRGRLAALAEELIRLARTTLPSQGAPLYAEAARIWTFLAANPPRATVAVDRAQQQGGMVDVERAAAQIALSARTRNGAV